MILAFGPQTSDQKFLLPLETSLPAFGHSKFSEFHSKVFDLKSGPWPFTFQNSGEKLNHSAANLRNTSFVLETKLNI
jgi:hypothetical protein